MLVAVASLVSGIPAYLQLNPSLDTLTWVPVQIHAAGAQAGRLAGGSVMTLAPIFPLEGGARIYPQLASGPFAVRESSLLTEQERRRYNMETAEGLAGLMQSTPHSGILLGPEPGLEGPLQQYARDHSYRAVTLPDNLTLWIP